MAMEESADAVRCYLNAGTYGKLLGETL